MTTTHDRIRQVIKALESGDEVWTPDIIKLLGQAAGEIENLADLADFGASEIKRLRQIGVDAMDTWLCDYAADMVGIEACRAADERIIRAGGTLSYISGIANQFLGKP